jgi:hypothetical protein
MKKSMLFNSLLLLAIFPSYLFAQEIKLPTVEIRVSQDLVPAKVKDAFMNDFGPGHSPFAWVNSNTVFDTYEWAQIADPSTLEIYSYGLHSKTTSGSTLDALYSVDGKLINSREYIRDFKPSLNVMLALQNTQYKDWGIKKDSHLIKYSSQFSSSGSEKERYALVMQKGREKKTILLDEKGNILADRSGAHAELAFLDR